MNDDAGKAIPDDDDVSDIDDDDDEVSSIDTDDDDDFTDTVILSASDADVDIDDLASTAEINVEQLMKELDKTDGQDAARRKAIRRRLEELAEDKSFEDTYAVDFDKD